MRAILIADSTSIRTAFCSVRFAISYQCLRVSALQCHRAFEQTLDRVGDIVTLIQHVDWREAGSAAQLSIHQLVEYQENLERIDGAGIQIVVAIFGIVEMKAAKALKLNQARNDLLDVGRGRVMTEVYQALHIRAELSSADEAGAPVRNHRRVKRRLVEFVLDEQAPSVGNRRDYHAHALEIALERLVHVELTGKVRAVANPHSQCSRTELLADLDALDVVRDRLL